MAKDPKPMEVLNAQAKQGVNETKQATDRMGSRLSRRQRGKHWARLIHISIFSIRRISVVSFGGYGNSMAKKLQSFAEKNVAATHQFIQQLEPS